MDSTIAVIATVAALAIWRLRLRRHPNWPTHDDARFYVSSGTWAAIITLYWFQQSRLDPHWVWQLWPVLAFVSMLLLVRGVNDLGARPACDAFIPAADQPRTREGSAVLPTS